MGIGVGEILPGVQPAPLTPCYSRTVNALLRDIIKRMRTCCNIKAQHCNAIGSSDWDFEYLTPYERGRMSREVPRVGRDLLELSRRNNESLTYWLYMYMMVKAIQPGAFSLKDGGNWTSLHDFVSKRTENLDSPDFGANIQAIHEILYLPQGEVLGRIMLLKLTLR